ncbi:hypothetical protein HOLleu_29528 [Holothuria leucospilota]|uniref:Uncharacterized protein n=1 Tax=Holothuria leucospilota TaxID=206669 RepID=A0A9Q1BP20_HOLLE|nr:hypothetical protein HOLleu_29528 [Holothuria leucospilota]
MLCRFENGKHLTTLQRRRSLEYRLHTSANGDWNLRDGIFLGHILKYRCSSKNSQSVAASQAEAIKFSIQTVPISTDVAQAAKKKDTRYKQPFLLGRGPEKKANKFVWTGNYHCH